MSVSKKELKDEILLKINGIFDQEGEDNISNTGLAIIIGEEYGHEDFSHRSFRYWAGDVRRSRIASRESIYNVSAPNVQKDHFVNKLSMEELVELKKSELDEKINKKFDGDELSEINYEGCKVVTSIKDAIEHFDIDTDKYDIKADFGQSMVTMKLLKTDIVLLNDKERMTYNHRPLSIINYNCKIYLSPKKYTATARLKKAIKLIKKYDSPYYPTYNADGSGDGVFFIADMHLGLLTKTYSPKVTADRLAKVAAHIENENCKNVHIIIPGDLVEAGAIMHDSQVYEIDTDYTGVTGGRAVYELLKKYLFNNVSNLRTIGIVHGNHDRLSRNKKEANPNSSICQLLHYFLKDNMPDTIDIKYDRNVLPILIDGIGYIVSHGDLGLSKKPYYLIDNHGFGDQADYHVLVSAHLHTREQTKMTIKKGIIYKDEVVVSHDTAKFRMVKLPPMCDTNKYADELGMSGSAGFVKMERATDPLGKKLPNIKFTDFVLE